VTATKTLAPLRYIGKCANGHGHRYDAETVFANRANLRGDVFRCHCGKGVAVKAIAGRYVPERKCGARCLGAVGPACDCQCGGENHGGAHSG
jgi:hypothetical protein